MFELFVLPCLIAVIAKVIAKGQRPSFLIATSFDDVNVMSMWPSGEPMKKWTE